MTTPPYSKFCEPEAAVTGFEGPEKRLEIDFKRSPSSLNLNGLRDIPQATWQEMLDFAKCTIISHTQNEYFDAFILSESSLFVYPYKVMVKTCGTTTLLSIIPKLLQIANICDLTVEFVMFSRKNYLFPHLQKDPHNRWDDEVGYLNTIFEGSSYVIGPTFGDHWYLYLADYSDNSRIITPEKTLEIMMHKLDPVVASQFYRKEETCDKDKFPGVADLIEDSDTDEFNFTPCGYSMNGLSKEAYYTIHVTPELICSYASFETNISLPSYTKLIQHVLALFKPGTFTVTFFSEKATAAAATSSQPFAFEIDGYVLKHRNFSELEGNCDILMMNYESVDYASQAKLPKKVKLPVEMMQPMIYA
jgi:S-adenosylmethionine decarboxylase